MSMPPTYTVSKKPEKIAQLRALVNRYEETVARLTNEPTLNSPCYTKCMYKFCASTDDKYDASYSQDAILINGMKGTAILSHSKKNARGELVRTKPTFGSYREVKWADPTASNCMDFTFSNWKVTQEKTRMRVLINLYTAYTARGDNVTERTHLMTLVDKDLPMEGTIWMETPFAHYFNTTPEMIAKNDNQTSFEVEVTATMYVEA
jgi:hypothetical protein